METATETFEDEIFNLESLDNETEFKTLIRSIKLSDGFSLLFARANEISDQKRLAESIKNEFPEKKIKIISFDKPIKHLLDELKETLQTEKNDAVLIYGLNSSFPTKKSSPRNIFVKNLNASRNSFPRTINCPIVLFIPEYAITSIMQGAIDFFSIRSGVFYFESQIPAKQGQFQAISSTHYRELGFLTIEERKERIKTIEILLDEEDDPERKITLLIKLGQITRFSGDYKKADAVFNKVLQLLRKKKNSHSYTFVLNELAINYQSQGRYDEAIEKIEEALKIDEKTIGIEHPDYATRLSNLAVVYQSQGRYDEAIEKYEEALKIDEKTIGIEHPDYAIDLNNLAVVYKSQGRYDEAIEKYEEALKIGEKTIGIEHPDYATLLNNLAVVYQSQGRYDEAIEKYEEALSIFEKTLPENHPHTIQLRESVKRCRKLLEQSK